MNQTRTDERTQTAGADVRESGMPDGQAPAAQQQGRAQPLTAVQRAQQVRLMFRQQLIDSVVENRGDIEKLLKQYGAKFDFFLAALKIGLNNAAKADQGFLDVSSNAQAAQRATAFVQAAIRAASMSLMPDGKQGAIVRYADDYSFLPMVEGYIEVLHRTGLIKDINHDVVMEEDEFRYKQGDDGLIEHYPDLNRNIDAEPRGAWCIVNTKDGGRYAEVVDKASLDKIRKTARADKGPRKNWGAEMDRKAPFRRLVKRLPKSPLLQMLIDADDANYDPNRAGLPDRRPVSRQHLFSDKRAPATEDEDQRLPEGVDEQGQEDAYEPDQTDSGGADEAQAKPAAPKSGGKKAAAARGKGKPASKGRANRKADAAKTDQAPAAVQGGAADQSGDSEGGAHLDRGGAQDHGAAAGVSEAGADAVAAGGGGSGAGAAGGDQGGQGVRGGDARDWPIISRLAEPILKAADVTSLMQASADASDDEAFPKLQPASKKFLRDLSLRRKDEIVAAEPLRLKLAVDSPVREYTDPKLWLADMLAKMSAISGPALKAFWRANADYVDAAMVAHSKQAERVLSVAESRGLLHG